MPKLEHIYTPNIYGFFTQRSICLEEISSNLHTSLESTDAVLAENIVRSPYLKWVDLQCCYNAGPLAAAAIQSHFESLEELNLSQCSSISSTHLLAILQQSCRVRVLVTMMESSKGYPEMPVFSAMGMLAASGARRRWSSLYA